jgi:hypothetical protein
MQQTPQPNTDCGLREDDALDDRRAFDAALVLTNMSKGQHNS